MSKHIKNISAVLLFIVAAFVVWNTFFSGKEEVLPTASVEDPALPSDGNESVPIESGREVLALLAEMKAIRLDNTLLGDSIFASLRDWSVTLSPEPQGRLDPFAPIGAEARETSQAAPPEKKR